MIENVQRLEANGGKLRVAAKKAKRGTEKGEKSCEKKRDGEYVMNYYRLILF